MAVCMACGRVFADQSPTCPACGDDRPAGVITPPDRGRPKSRRSVDGLSANGHPEGGAGSPADPEGGAGSPADPEGGAGSPADPEGGAGSPADPEGGAGSPADPEGGAGSPADPEGGAGSPADPEGSSSGASRAPRRAEIMAARRRDARPYNRALRWVREHRVRRAVARTAPGDTGPGPQPGGIYARRSFWTWSDDWPAQLAWLAVVLIVIALGYLSYTHGGFVPLLDRLDKAIRDLGDVAFAWAPSPWRFAAGSALQVAVPLAFAAYFCWRRERVALVLALAWSGESLYNVSFYAADATRMTLPFYVTDGNGDPHAWHELLAGLGALRHAETIAYALQGVAALLLTGALVLAVMWCLRPPERDGQVEADRPRTAGPLHHDQSQKHMA